MIAPDRHAPTTKEASAHAAWAEAIGHYNRCCLAEAGAAFDRALAENPGHLESRLGLARVLRDQGRLDQALSCCHNAMAAAPDRAEVFTLTGEVLGAMGRGDQALACLTQALDLAPQAPGVLLAVGRALESQGDLASAVDFYDRAVKAAGNGENHVANRRRALNRLGAGLNRLGQRDKAMACFQQVLSEDPQNPSARHLLAALQGKTPDNIPSDYVKTLFDAFSSGFDRHMTDELAYRTPKQLFEFIEQHLPPGKKRFAAAIDLGCGTGLSGKAFRHRIDHLTGVDLAPLMIEKARAKGLYDRLAAGDIGQFLLDEPGCYDLFIAADVLVYIGNLVPIFAACHSRAMPGAHMVFSTESCENTPYRLMATGRFAHHSTYVRETASACQWQVTAFSRAHIRKEGGAWIQGDLFVLTAPA
ncbi:MAG: tetratricopeptide repeat protein [Desulfobacterales bacterium]|nr:tetratricopeptide repeat protein [Desulfobacterales bacterium]